MFMYCNNHAAIYIAHNHVFHEKDKHIEVNCHFVRDAVARKLISTPFTSFSKDVVDMFTKPVTPSIFFYLYNTQSMIDICAPT